MRVIEKKVVKACTLELSEEEICILYICLGWISSDELVEDAKRRNLDVPSAKIDGRKLYAEFQKLVCDEN
jgi:hypothetical protein